ncbi:MAG: acyl-CoA thioesterase, partial [Acidimicrobiia bacterium]
MSVSLHPVTDLVSLLDLEMVKPDAFLGVSPAIGWDRIYGGQVVAQALRAAGLTVAPEYRGHSLHAYYVHPRSTMFLGRRDRTQSGSSVRVIRSAGWSCACDR